MGYGGEKDKGRKESEVTEIAILLEVTSFRVGI